MELKLAMFYKKENGIQCELCPKNCKIKEGETGFCRVRKVEGGELIPLTYGKITSIAYDPIEKKPLYHFYPGKVIFSIGSMGCNFACDFCQNWEISQDFPPLQDLSPISAVSLASKHNSIGIAYTYNEPLIWYEYVFETSKIAREKGLKNVLVTNGFVNEAPLKELLPYIDAMNIDLKAFNEKFYRTICKGFLTSVMNTIEVSYKKVHIEITNLLIPNQNDSIEEIVKMVDWISSLSPEIPVHFSRYFPQYKMKEPPTDTRFILKVREIAKKKLKYVYTGNFIDEESNITYCPNCSNVLISRIGYQVEISGIIRGKCKRCGTSLNIVGV
jgi:pyruvate formate lyase activating enzyme